MDRQQIAELHSIQHIENLPSLLARGILSHRRAERLGHQSIAEVIQDIRANKAVPGGRPIHDYACLYFNARNKMMYSRLDRHQDLCVLAVSPEVLDFEGVVVTDSNASSGYARFYEPSEGIPVLDRDEIFAEWWTHPDPIEQWRRGSATCAEVLVPHVVAAKFIERIYVSGNDVKSKLEGHQPVVPVAVNHRLFFR